MFSNLKQLFFNKHGFLNSKIFIYIVLIALILIHIVLLYITFFGVYDSTGTSHVKKLGDFISFWSGGREAIAGKAYNIYNHAYMKAQHVIELGYDYDYDIEWVMPPVFLFYTIPFSLFNYTDGYILWMLATTIIYTIMVYLTVPNLKAVLGALAMPSVLICAAYGQTGALSAALIGCALLFIDKKPILAGVFLGLLIYKPQIGIVFPFALAAGGYWKTFISASLTVVVLILLSIIAFGYEVWRLFLFENYYTLSVVLNADRPVDRLQTIFGFVRFVTDSSDIAKICQFVSSVLSILIVTIVWKCKFSIELKGVIVTLSIFLITPYLQIYESVILTVAILLLIKIALRDGFLRYEIYLYIISSLVIYAGLTEFPIVMISICILSYIAIKRIFSERLAQN